MKFNEIIPARSPRTLVPINNDKNYFYEINECVICMCKSIDLHSDENLI